MEAVILSKDQYTEIIEKLDELVKRINAKNEPKKDTFLDNQEFLLLMKIFWACPFAFFPTLKSPPHKKCKWVGLSAISFVPLKLHKRMPLLSLTQKRTI